MLTHVYTKGKTTDLIEKNVDLSISGIFLLVQRPFLGSAVAQALLSRLFPLTACLSQLASREVLRVAIGFKAV